MLNIEVFSDVICPWCFIGKRRLDRVLTTEIGSNVVLRWRPFMLYPYAPQTGWNRFEFLQRRFGSSADQSHIPKRLRQEAEEMNLELRYDLIQYTPNTMLAHRLMEWCYLHFDVLEEVQPGTSNSAQHQLADLLFEGYFCRGLNVGDIDVLIRLAEEAEIADRDLREYLLSSGGTQEVNKQLARAPDLDIVGVPSYLMQRRFLLPGAQSEDTIAKIITRAKIKLAY
jgi:predicted DsbA family dithiol-disulfide isomerase